MHLVSQPDTYTDECRDCFKRNYVNFSLLIYEGYLTSSMYLKAVNSNLPNKFNFQQQLTQKKVFYPIRSFMKEILRGNPITRLKLIKNLSHAIPVKSLKVNRPHLANEKIMVIFELIKMLRQYQRQTLHENYIVS